jgi:hypothetical protein
VFNGLTAGPSQVWGAVRLVPLLRETPITDLRLHARLFDPDDLSVVRIDRRTVYASFVPHAFVASWGNAVGAAYGTQLTDPDPAAGCACIQLRFRRRMAQREAKQRLRFLPLHLALDGYLALQFGGPAIAWQEWTHRTVAYGLSPRVEAAYNGSQIPGLDEALRIFEIHPAQSGVLVYLADALATAFVVPHPEDYRALHATLLQDLYGELIYQYANLYPAVDEFHARLDDDRIASVADLRAQIAQNRVDWAAFTDVMAGGLRPGERTTTPVYRMGRYLLSRFLPAFDPDVENHVGETIESRTGELAYLQTFRLSAAQTRRGHLLSRLAAHDWELDAAAAALGTDRKGLAQRLDRAGFGHLLRPDVIDAARRQARAGAKRR